MGYVMKIMAVVGIAAIVGLSFSPSVLKIQKDVTEVRQQLASPTEYLQDDT